MQPNTIGPFETWHVAEINEESLNEATYCYFDTAALAAETMKEAHVRAEYRSGQWPAHLRSA